MKTENTEKFWAVVVLLLVFFTGYVVGEAVTESKRHTLEYAKGVADGISLNDGNQWACKRQDNSTVCNRIAGSNSI